MPYLMGNKAQCTDNVLLYKVTTPPMKQCQLRLCGDILPPLGRFRATILGLEFRGTHPCGYCRAGQ